MIVDPHHRHQGHLAARMHSKQTGRSVRSRDRPGAIALIVEPKLFRGITVPTRSRGPPPSAGVGRAPARILPLELVCFTAVPMPDRRKP